MTLISFRHTQNFLYYVCAINSIGPVVQEEMSFQAIQISDLSHSLKRAQGPVLYSTLSLGVQYSRHFNDSFLYFCFVPVFW